ncbi:hypothetical protein PEPS_13690 [Persicobacter psychrovividus]|uniref:Uncharacterized protein n=1 Tax=Persicobacter psychrovividus TaxID=387638 RepID=A0ABN6L7K3_9BACT|nr:hypothetical protein PEPS_13690 [Persicobacter psychrovividus]
MYWVLMAFVFLYGFYYLFNKTPVDRINFTYYAVIVDVQLIVFILYFTYLRRYLYVMILVGFTFLLFFTSLLGKGLPPIFWIILSIVAILSIRDFKKV